MEEHHCCSHFGAVAVGGPWSDSEGFKASQSSRHTPQVIVKLTRWLQLICNSEFNHLHVHLKLKSREVHRAIQKDSGHHKHPVSFIESQGSYWDHLFKPRCFSITLTTSIFRGKFLNLTSLI